MGTKLLAPALALLALTIGCGGGDDAETKQAGMAPASAVAAPTAAPVTAATDSAAGSPAGAADSAAQPEEAISLARESFSYTGGPRDPFQSLLAAAKIGPELADLILVAIYYDTRNPGNSVIVLRDKITSKRYNLRPGERLGRARLSSVLPKDAIFTVDDFGTARQVTLTLRKQEDIS